jgi:ribosomal protein S27AE
MTSQDSNNNQRNDMEPNSLVLNPRSERNGELKCSRCGEKVVEVSGHHENRFECGCDGLVEFEIPVKGNDDKDNLDIDAIIDNDYTVHEEQDVIECPICKGSGTTSVSLGKLSGTVECDNCGGTGEVAPVN